MDSLTATERIRIRNQTAEDSVKLAVAGRWEEAVALNRELLERVGGDVETFNRLGKALSELGQIAHARSAYQDALRLQPGNSIAVRNLNKLAVMEDSAAAAPKTAVRTSTFIAESGTSSAVTLQAVDTKQLAPLNVNDILELEVKGNAVNVLNGGHYIGMVDPKIGMRLSRLMEGGNRYKATVVSAVEPVRVMLQETLQHPSQKGKVSFPQPKNSSGVRAYVRKGLLRDEVTLDLGVDDEEDDTPDGYSTISQEDDDPTFAANNDNDDSDEDDLDDD